MSIARVIYDIEIYEEYGDDHWAQEKYLVHGYQDILWTSNPLEAVKFMEHSILMDKLAAVPPVDD